jgi:pyruvate dehydrogenase E1 component alpha subunit
VHLAIGHEGAAVGVCENLKRKDLVLSYHRSHHHFLAKGASAEKLLLELLGDKKGCSKGKGGSTHLQDLPNGFVASTAIIGGALALASGLAHAQQLKNSKNVVVCFVGDASPEEGSFSEVLNLISLWNLKVLIVIEDNNLSCYTEKKIRQSFKSFSQFAKTYSIPYKAIMGNNPIEIINVSNKLIKQIKKTSRPAILKITTYRRQEHCGPEQDDNLDYRSDLKLWKKLDPIRCFEKQIKTEIRAKIFAQESTKINKLFSKYV